ncbi:MAG: hypothetical protein QM541_01480 [Flavobacterium sp.]|nr:hypothetical protein [Flavobacterium sp.]
MIQSLSNKYNKQIAIMLLSIFYLELLMPTYAAAANSYNHYRDTLQYEFLHRHKPFINNAIITNPQPITNEFVSTKVSSASRIPNSNTLDIGGPSSPEASSFKAVGSDNLVNLFTGDLSYSIPLLDVGGYPVNLFYSGGITMEQEASWVGLGWNINPGSISRNMRGVPDDFNGEDLLTQSQNTKPNRTWGGELAKDFEFTGLKFPLGIKLSSGMSYNNYLGLELITGASLSASISLSEQVKAEKSAVSSLGLDVSIGARLSSRSGLTLSPSLGLNTSLANNKLSLGINLSTSYNSRIGIQELNISGESAIKFSGKSEISQVANGVANKLLHIGSTISFAKKSYMPVLRMPLEHSCTSVQLEAGVGFFGFRASETINGYYSESKVPDALQVIKKPLVGYIYSEKAVNDINAVMDLNRLNDAEVTPNTPVISAPQYTYDIFSIQGEGTGGTIRAYRGDLGIMRDNVTVSTDGTLSLGADFAATGHFGFNINTVSTPTKVGGWEDANNTLRETIAFRQPTTGIDFENVYFKNPGELTVTNEDIISRVGHDSLVRFQLSGSNDLPRIESSLELFSRKMGVASGNRSLLKNLVLPKREKRTQVTTMLTAADATQVGLEKYIRTYKIGNSLFDPIDHHIVYDSFPRVDDTRKKHHISEVDVLEQSGMRYVYGLPVYSLTQKDFTFSVGNMADNNNMVAYDSTNDPTIHSSYMNNNSKIDGYTQIQETPAYASSFLLTGLLSPDYVDITNNGITEDDLGNAVKFNYTQSQDVHRWRTPRSNETNKATIAHFNDGKRSEIRDNKATITYGEREVWYLNSIESKSMVAIFTTSSRDDSKGVKSAMNGSINAAEDANKKLSRIDLYTKSDIKLNGITNAKPIKTVQFYYSYSLCKGTPDNVSSNGKLTLDSISFSYNGQVKLKKDKYVFNYGNKNSQADNPNYQVNASDRWGTFKPIVDPISNQAVNPNSQNNIDFPYTAIDKAIDDRFAASWNLKKVLLPSGGQMEFKYEADDYAYVQDRRACNMFNIYGLGSTTRASTSTKLYNYNSSTENLYIYVKLPQPLKGTNYASRKAEIYSKYLEGLNQLAFKLQVIMPKGIEPLTVYATQITDYGVCTNSDQNDIIYIKLGDVEGKSPLAKSATGFLIESLPSQAFNNEDIDVGDIVSFILGVIGAPIGIFANLPSAFTGPEAEVRMAGRGMNIVLPNSFVRLSVPNKIKYGGGYRVKQVLVRDNWSTMANKYTSTYGQDYDYTRTEKINGLDAVISSGVASYEPGIGSEENPFREIIQFSNKLPLGSAQYGAIEAPILEGMYPSPVVGYSKVTVRSIHRKGTHGDSTLRSSIGKQVTEYYTAREYPSISTYTPMQSMDYHSDPFFSFFKKEIIDKRIISQGFLVETNDMHGKIKSQSAYSENDEKTPVSASYHTYKNTGKNGLNDKVDYVYNDAGGIVKKGNIGVDVELMTDVREFSYESNGVSIQPQFDSYIWFFLITLWPTFAYTENKYRAVTTTKTIAYHAIEDSVVVMDKGSVISTKTTAYDAETGTPIVTKTANEFNAPIYNVSYPAYWAYSGMGLAYKNIDATYTGNNFSSGRILNPSFNISAVFESGDELYVTSQGTTSPDCVPVSPSVTKLWVFDLNKNTTALTAPVKDLVFMDASGNLFTKSNVSFRIIRSGHRNLLDAKVGGATLMSNPIVNNGSTKSLTISATSKVVTASAVEFKEKWQTDRGVIQRMSTISDGNCGFIEVADCNGNHLEKNINPYTKGLIGNYKSHQSLVFYGSRTETSPTSQTDISKNGYLANFKHYWNFNTLNNLVPDTLSTQWVWNSQITKVNAKGLELETKNALGIYTAAQYGFNKTMPVAVTNNSRANEAFFEGFEDDNYNESLSSNITNCYDSKHINLSDLGSIVNTDGLDFNAHSGKRVLKWVSNSIIKSFSKTNNTSNDSPILPVRDTIKILSEEGSVFADVNTYPYNMPFDTINLSSMDMLFRPYNDTIIYYSNSVFTRLLNFGFSNYRYIEVSQDGIYEVTNTYYVFSGNIVNYTGMSFSIQTLDGEYINQTQISNNAWQSKYSVCLKKGIYKVFSYCSGNNSYTCQEGNGSSNGCIPYQIDLPEFYFNVSISPIANQNSVLTGYKSLTSENGCIYTKPISGNDSMFNPTFSVPLNKPMLFSAWVHEEGNYKASFDSNQVKIGDSTLKPVGAVIEGWQRYEGVFTASQNNHSLQIINNSKLPIYFDDIRIHPFNANMKSYVYDPRTLRLSAELDENNYASFYEYDEEGQLVRVKKETIQGIKTIKETRSAKQKNIIDIVE